MADTDPTGRNIITMQDELSEFHSSEYSHTHGTLASASLLLNITGNTITCTIRDIDRITCGVVQGGQTEAQFFLRVLREFRRVGKLSGSGD